MFRNTLRNVLAGLVFAAVIIAGMASQPTALTAAAAQTSAHQTERSPDLDFYAFGPLVDCLPSVAGHVKNGKYFRYIRNDCGRKVKIRFVRLSDDNGPTYTLSRHQEGWIKVAVGSSERTHYAILLMDPEVTSSAGVWTPQYGKIHYANKSRHAVIACSPNPLKRKAVMNVLTASMSGSWHLADFSVYVAPGHSVCLAAHQKPGVYMRLRVEWVRDKAKWRQTYQVAPLY